MLSERSKSEALESLVCLDAISLLNTYSISITKGISTIVFVPCDVDSIFAARILCTCFEQLSVRFLVRPLIDTADLVRSFEELVIDNDDVRSAVMINTLGTYDVVDWTRQQIPRLSLQRVHFFLFDSHRPLHPSNLRDANESVLCVHDDQDDLFPDDEDLDRSEEIQRFWAGLPPSPEDDDNGIFGEQDDLELDREVRMIARQRKQRIQKRLRNVGVAQGTQKIIIFQLTLFARLHSSSSPSILTRNSIRFRLRISCSN